jgi:hypothetical protein
MFCMSSDDTAEWEIPPSCMGIFIANIAAH